MLATAALLVFVLTCSAVGLRLLWIALQTGSGPAWSCGLGFTFISLLGYPLTVVSGGGTSPVGEVNHAVNAAGTLFVAAGLSAFFAFTLETFRRHAWWAWALTCGCILLLAVAGFGQIGALAEADPAARSSDVIRGWGHVTGHLSAVCYAWIGAEGLLEWRRATRRVAVGLGDPVVADRFLMWGVFGVSTTVLNALLIALRLLGDDEGTWLLRQLALTGFGLVSATAAALAFFPPRAYTRWVRARAASA